MKRILAACLALAATAALATTTWTTVTTDAAGKTIPSYVRAVSGSFTSGSAAATCPTSATAGIDLQGLSGLEFQVETVTTSLPAGKKFIACLRNAKTGKWLPVSGGALDWATYATTLMATEGLTVTMDYSRIAWEPDLGTTITGVMYLSGVRRAGVR